MENLNRIFEELKNDLGKPGVFIKEISSTDIETKGYKKGYLLPFVAENEYKYYHIYIDEALKYEEKISVIFHEMGHVKLDEFLGFQEVDSRIKADRLKWTQFTEFHAFKNQLEEGKRLFENGVTSILSISIDFINETYSNPEITQPYKFAIEDIWKENIWKECVQLIEKNEGAIKK
ncbi:hypothetical protein AB9T89_06670 [Flavobacterium oncorhynchi]|uniref:hypothetical protein n=1 Tax=Flavobacterium oncorhynchi TaxID=728056 RepID=UPI00351A643D